VLDLTLAGAKYDVMKGALDILLGAPEFDLILAVVGSSARYQPQLAVQPIIDSAASARPLAAMLVPDAPEALARLTEAGIPCFRSPEACGDAIAAVLARRAPTAQAHVQRGTAATGRASSEADAYGVLDRLGVAHAPVVAAPLAGPVPALPFDFPVVVKVCSAAIPHKTEVGGVVLNVADATGLDAALATLRTNLSERAPGVPCDQVLVQPMCKGLAEVLLGYRVDAEAGPIVMLAAGGIWAEVARDRSLRLAPVTLEAAHEMIGEVRALKTLTGLRGRARGDLDALARAIERLSRLGDGSHPDVLEAEINPLLVMAEGQGVLAVDALVMLS
jgi:acyl-CoA synthetase (NDP forming)